MIPNFQEIIVYLAGISYSFLLWGGGCKLVQQRKDEAVEEKPLPPLSLSLSLLT